MAPLLMATATSFQPPSVSYHTHSLALALASTNNSNFKPFPSLCPSRRFFVNTPTPVNSNRCVVVATSNLNFPLISPDDNWGTWTALFATGAFGLWSERTKLGRMISAALVSILLGLAASNIGIIPHEARAYSIVMEFLLPLTIPLMLFRADMRDVIKSTGNLLLAFLIGSVATTVGTLVAYLIVPMRSLGQDSWKIASALMASYIGGDTAQNLNAGSGDNSAVLQTATALAVSFAICKCGTHIVQLLKIQGGTLPAITAIVVILATLLPKQIGYLAPAGDAVAAISIQVFFAVLGASGSVWNVMNVAPSIFIFAFIQVTVHLLVILGLGKLLNFDLKVLLLGSNANIGGPTTASGMATAKGWDSLVVPGILVGIFGISIATYIAYFFGIFVLKRM
ncbi:hypothetical protein M8C21_008978 [Ambrosia artemisiifolia]|uniref:Membrane protein YjcL n=1 Tax=Ambrosia artemisiifolia TaxID=4212 RepID=A0AAD5G964_AMBAR|nr:hypothetical protein M8C21_008978 [Ambrosia artemisiifolia]